MNTKVEYLLIGGGVASVKAAMAIRKIHPAARVLIVNGENRYPYDRPPLSKDFLINFSMADDDPESKHRVWYEQNAVELILGNPVVDISRSDKVVTLADGATWEYEKLLIATGAGPLIPKIPGIDTPGICSLRTIDDAIAIRERFKSANSCILVGGGYIGLEVAAASMSHGIATTVIDRGPYPWHRIALPEVGEFVTSALVKNNVTEAFDTSILSLEKDGEQFSVKTDSLVMNADLVILGLGAKPYSHLAEKCGLATTADGIVVDQFFQTSDPNIFSAGGVACYPDPFVGKHVNADHHTSAGWQGEAAGKSMAGEPEPYRKVPYFWSDFFDIHMALRGNWLAKPSEIIGEVKQGTFLQVSWNEDGTLANGLFVAKRPERIDPVADRLEEIILSAEVPTRDELLDLARPE